MKLKKIAATVLAAAVLAVAAPLAGAVNNALSVTASAEDTLTEGDYTYTVNEDGETVTITKYSGTDTEVVIPGTLGGKAVTTIGATAFEYCKSLTSVTIPDSVTTISNPHFSGNTLLANITVGETNPNYSAVDGVLFNKDKSELLCYPAGRKNKSYSIPNGVTTIYYDAFADCTSLTSVTLPDSMTNCDSDMPGFFGCLSLESILVDENHPSLLSVDGILFRKDMTAIEKYPCSKKGQSYTTPDDVTTIGFGAFRKCTLLTNITLSDGVESLSSFAFAHCTSLTNITIPKSITHITSYDFSECTSLTTVNYGGTKAEWEAIQIDIYNEYLTNAEIICTDGIINEREHETSDPTSSETSEPTSSDTSEPTVEIVDEDTGVKTEVSKDDEKLDGAEFEATPADHPTLWDLIKKIIEKAVDTVESVTEETQKSLEEAAESVKNGKGFAYDMGFKKNGKEVQPGKEVSVTVPVPEKFKNDIDKLNVYHLTEKGAVYVPSWVKDGSIIFKTKGFSPYVITSEKLANAVVEDDTSTAPGDTDKNSDSTDDNSGSDQKGTGITLAIAPIVLACAVVVIASKKRK